MVNNLIQTDELQYLIVALLNSADCRIQWWQSKIKSAMPSISGKPDRRNKREFLAVLAKNKYLLREAKTQLLFVKRFLEENPRVREDASFVEKAETSLSCNLANVYWAMDARFEARKWERKSQPSKPALIAVPSIEEDGTKIRQVRG